LASRRWGRAGKRGQSLNDAPHFVKDKSWSAPLHFSLSAFCSLLTS
jgi:predicted DNA-binding WGR domain protein